MTNLHLSFRTKKNTLITVFSLIPDDWIYLEIVLMVPSIHTIPDSLFSQVTALCLPRRCWPYLLLLELDLPVRVNC